MNIYSFFASKIPRFTINTNITHLSAMSYILKTFWKHPYFFRRIFPDSPNLTAQISVIGPKNRPAHPKKKPAIDKINRLLSKKLEKPTICISASKLKYLK